MTPTHTKETEGEQMNNKEEALTAILKDFDFVVGGVRVIMLTHRKKEGGNHSKADRHMKRWIVNGEEEFKIGLVQALELHKDPMRIYVTVNERNLDKAIRKFKELQLEADYSQTHSFYLDMKNRWISSLCKPSSREQKRFILDVDYDDLPLSIEEIKSRLDREQIKIVREYHTRNGMHIVTDPFNYPKILPEFKHKVHVDGMALVYF